MYIFFNDTATTEIYTLSLHDALPIFDGRRAAHGGGAGSGRRREPRDGVGVGRGRERARDDDRRRPLGIRRSEEHTSELQSRQYLVCRLLLEKKPLTRSPSSFLTSYAG